MLTGIGGLLIAIAFIALIYWLLMAKKAGRIQSVPFRRPSEIAQMGPSAADAKGLVSCEGAVQGQPLIAPMSGQPCLYWEISIDRVWEKYDTDSNGNSVTKSGTTNAVEQKQGTIFMVSDGQAGVYVDAQKKPDTDLKQTHSSTVKIGMLLPGELQFGNLRTQVPPLPGGENVKAFEGKEKIVPFVQGQNMFVLGKLGAGPGGPMLGEIGALSGLMLSDKGREATLGTAVKNAKYGKFTTIGSGAVGTIMVIVGLVTAKPETPATAGGADGSTTAAATGATKPASVPAKPAATAPAKPAATTPAKPATPAPTKK